MHRVKQRPAGMLAFTIVWFGQLVSLIGSGLTLFALTLWAWQETGSATALALVGVFSFTPLVLMSPIAGALVDRWNRKLVMMLSDLAAGISTIVVLLLYLTDSLEIWHLYIAGAFAGAFQAFQWPAYSAAISTMLPKEQYGRANGMMSFAEAAAAIVAPILAGVLLGPLGIAGIMAIDIATFAVAISTLLVIAVPQPKRTAAGEEARGSLLKESVYGFRYILSRPSLLGLQLVFLANNLAHNFSAVVITPMILSRTGNNEEMLGIVLSAGGVGGVVGGFVMSGWGGPKRRVHGVLGGMALGGIVGTLLMGVGRSLPLWVAASFMSVFLIPIINGSNQAIWQAKVAPDVQGRVFSARRMIAWIAIPLAQLLGGPMADYVFEPAMQPDGSLAGTFGWLVGTGPGAGMGLILILSGVMAACVGLSGYLFPAIRNAEILLPDHDPVTPEAAVQGAGDAVGEAQPA